MAKITKGRMNQRTVRKKPTIDNITMNPPTSSIIPSSIVDVSSVTPRATPFAGKVSAPTL
jgi:hypothetical protein